LDRIPAITTQMLNDLSDSEHRAAAAHSFVVPFRIELNFPGQGQNEAALSASDEFGHGGVYGLLSGLEAAQLNGCLDQPYVQFQIRRHG
jgi:hypothetical protein